MCHFFGFCITLQRHPPTSIDNLLLLGYRLRHAGFDGSGTDTVDGDALAAKLNRQRPRQTNDAMLRRRVWTAPLRCAKAFGGGDIHDSRIIETGADGAVQPERYAAGPSVTQRGLIPRRIIAIAINRSGNGNTRIVHQQIDAAEMLGDLAYHPDYCIAIGEIDLPRFGRFARSE